MDAPQAALCVRRESPVMLEVANVRCAPREWNVWSRRLPAVGIRRVSFARAALATRGRRCRLLVATTAIASRRSCDCIGLHACRRLYRSPLSLTACRNRQTTRLGHVLVVRLHLRCSNLLVLAHVSSATCSSLACRDLERTLQFYVQVFGVREYFRDATSIQVQGPGAHDVIAFEYNPGSAGSPGGIDHFGFRLLSPTDIELAIAEVERAGGKLLRRGEFAPGYPYAYVADPDGYEIEIWYE